MSERLDAPPSARSGQRAGGCPYEDLLEEVEHLEAAYGLAGPQIAQRLGTSWPALSRRLARHGPTGIT